MRSMTINRRFLLSGLPVLIAVALVATARGSGGPPSAEKRPVADEYHGVKVVDDYRWLEKWEDPRVQAWSNAQNAYARSVLDTLPGVSAIRKRVTELHGAEINYGGVSWRTGRLLALKYQSGKDQPSLVTLTGPNAL